jgi:hypothetical protein
VTAATQTFKGRCHCGAISFRLRTGQSPAQWNVRACQCSFCRAHGARTFSDRQGSVAFRFADPAKLRRYRFGTKSSDFVVCGECGVYLAAVVTSANGQFATLNINTIGGLTGVPEATPVSYEGEAVQERKSRREQRWTPVAGIVLSLDAVISKEVHHGERLLLHLMGPEPLAVRGTPRPQLVI